ncbi:oxidoreductase [Pilimelia terevasa]|uniref:Oxidoreductase n=1 Tax=Pilimelia terevasa TaxID=53372 RepID=A0A8J3BQ23_9ACTN|nr:PhzF family phenazine biosynthesis isomerase [Pilimelia terevasa]GGK26901.1 oxidoreductase [Pilimelia terevasa]
MEILRYAAFTTDPAGGNPAGVVLDAAGVSAARMRATAAEVGYSETAFVTAADGRRAAVRFFSPEDEVPFCGHATIATAVAYAERHGPGPLTLATAAGEVAVVTAPDAAGRLTATLTSVPPRVAPLPADDLAALRGILGWTADDLDPALPAAVAYAGAWHPVLAAATRARLADLRYDLPTLRALMAARGWTTVNLVWRRDATTFHARNPFPPGGVYEDPATGAAAAALGGYLRALDLVATPAEITVHQGAEMGRPSRLRVTVPADLAAGVSVTGPAVRLAG